MRLTFFDFNINYGGGPQGTVYLARKKICIGNEDKPIIRFIDAVKQIPAFLEIRKRLIKKILEIDPDAIWVNNEKSLAFLMSNRRLKKYPVAVYYRGWFTKSQAKGLFCWLLRNKASAIMVHAKATVEKFKSRGFPEKKLFYAPNVIDIDRTQKDSQNDLDVTLPKKEKTPKILLTSARLERFKGHLTAVNALALLKETGYDPVLWLPGKIGTGVSNVFRKELETRIEKLELKDNVFFVGWCNNMPALIKESDIVILPSHSEGFPRIVLESMLLKRPVCATPVGGIPEAIEDGKTGLLFPIDDAQALANSIKKLHLETQTNERIVKNAYNLVTNEFRPGAHTKTVTAMFESIVNK